MTFRVERASQLSGTPVMSYAIHVHAEMLKEGVCDPNWLMIDWNDGAVVAYLDEPTAIREIQRPIGIITYTLIQYRKELLIKLGSVALQWRRQGVYRMMWQELVAVARECGYGTITSAIRLDNQAARLMALSLGRVEESVNTTFTVPPS